MCNHRYPTGCSSIDIFGPVQENNFSLPFLQKSKNPGGGSKVQEAEVEGQWVLSQRGPRKPLECGMEEEDAGKCLGSGQEPLPGAGAVVGCYLGCWSHMVRGRPGKASFHGTLFSLHLLLGALSQCAPRPLTLSYILLSPELVLTSAFLYVQPK